MMPVYDFFLGDAFRVIFDDWGNYKLMDSLLLQLIDQEFHSSVARL